MATIRVPDRIVPASFLIVVLAIDLCIAWILLPNSSRGFVTKLLWTSTVIIGGAILTSLAVMREHWLEMMKELFRQSENSIYRHRYGPADYFCGTRAGDGKDCFCVAGQRYFCHAASSMTLRFSENASTLSQLSVANRRQVPRG